MPELCGKSGRLIKGPVVSREVAGIAMLSSIAIVLASTWYGVLDLVGIGASHFRPDLAVLTVGAVTAVWGGGFAFETLRHGLNAEERRKASTRVGLASALLAELMVVDSHLRDYVHKNGPTPDLSLEVFERAVSQVDLFPADAARGLARVNLAVRQYSKQRNRMFAAALIHHICYLAEDLVSAGGDPPSTFVEGGVSEQDLVDQLPEFPRGGPERWFRG